MDDLSSKCFREYATRVSFNMTLSRNQIAVLRTVRDERQFKDVWKAAKERINQRRPSVFQENRAELGCDDKNRWVPGAKSLQSMGLITWTAPTPNDKHGWIGHNPYALTEAGELMCRMLELAGLIPALAVNDNKKKQRGKKRA